VHILNKEFIKKIGNIIVYADFNKAKIMELEDYLEITRRILENEGKLEIFINLGEEDKQMYINTLKIMNERYKD
jgi:hypothetical protein